MNIGNELQKHYPDLYPQVEAIFNKHDPLGLDPGGMTPQNEYDLEIWELLPHLSTKKDEKSINSVLLDIFQDKFNEETLQKREKQRIKKIAQEISNSLK